MRYTDAIKREAESIGQWCRRYFGMMDVRGHSSRSTLRYLATPNEGANATSYAGSCYKKWSDRVSFMSDLPISCRTHNEGIGRRFTVGNMGGMRRVTKSNLLALISDPFMRDGQSTRESREEDERRVSGERPVGGGSAFRRRREAESRGHIHQLGESAGLHFPHHLASMGLHRDLADAELATDLLIQQAGHDQRHDLPFAAAE